MEENKEVNGTVENGTQTNEEPKTNDIPEESNVKTLLKKIGKGALVFGGFVVSFWTGFFFGKGSGDDDSGSNEDQPADAEKTNE